MPASLANSPKLSMGFCQRYWLSFTHIYYYLGFLPFHFELRPIPSSSAGNPTSFQVTREINNFQSAVCIFIHFILLCFTFFTMRHFLFRRDAAQGLQPMFLELTVTLLGTTVSLYYIYTAWWHSDWFEWLLLETLLPASEEKVEKADCELYGHLEKVQNWMSLICPITSILITFYTNYAMGHGDHDHDHLKPFANWKEGLGKVGMSLFSFLTSYVYIAVGHSGMLMFQGVVLSFRDKARKFIHELKDTNGAKRNSTLDIPDKFFELDKFITGVNRRFGCWILVTVMMSVPFYSKRFVELLKEEELTMSSVATVLYTYTIFFWLCSSASVGNQIHDKMREWLMEDANYSKLSPQQLTILMSKLHGHGGTLRGGSFFAISFPLIGTLISLIITWAFIDHNNNN